MMTKRAAVYTRLSRYRGAEDPSTSPERQRESCTQYALAKGWTVAHVFEDLDVSGAETGQRLDRPGLQSIRRLWDEIDVVVVPKLDRLARSVADFHTFAKEARAHGVDLVSVHEGLDLTTASGRFVATILAAFAEMESETISERTRGGRRGAAQQGRWGGPAPYGYRLVPHPLGRGKTLAVDDAEAGALREAAAQIVRGVPLSTVARWLTKNAPKPRRADMWTSTPLRQMLTSETVQGRLVSNGKVVRGPDGFPLAPFPAIFTAAEAAKIRAALGAGPNGKAPSAHDARLLSGLLTCSGCGRRLTVYKRPGNVDVYRCATRGRGGVCARPVTVSAPAVEAHVEAEFLAEVGDLPLFERQVVADSAGLAAVEDAIAAALSELATQATPDVFARLQDLQTERDRLASVQPVVVSAPTGQTMSDAWAEADTAGQRAMLADHYRDLVLLPGVRGRRGFDPARLEPVPVAWSPPR